MDFGDSGLPRDHRLERCFHRLQDLNQKNKYGDLEGLMRQLSDVARLLLQGCPADMGPVPLACASFLVQLDKDSYEYDNIRHDYGYDTFQAVKGLKSFHPLFHAPEYLHEALQDAEVPRAVRLHYGAQSIVGLRQLAEFYRQDPDRTDNDDLFAVYEHHVLIGKGCRGASALLDHLLEEEMKTCHALLCGEMLPAAQADHPASKDSDDDDRPVRPAVPRPPVLH